MKKNIIILSCITAVIITVTILFLKFQNPKTEPDASISNNNFPFTLPEGSSVLVKPNDISLSFIKVKEDSRCPSGVMCIWEGRVVVSVAVKTEFGSSVNLDLGLGSNEKFEEQVEGNFVKLLNVTKEPNPKATFIVSNESLQNHPERYK